MYVKLINTEECLFNVSVHMDVCVGVEVREIRWVRAGGLSFNGRFVCPAVNGWKEPGASIQLNQLALLSSTLLSLLQEEMLNLV